MAPASGTSGWANGGWARGGWTRPTISGKIASRSEDKEGAAPMNPLFLGSMTALLGRFVLREPMTVLQWLGIALVIGGVAVLTAQG